MKKRLIWSLSLPVAIGAPAALVLSCSNIQNEANEIYKRIYKESLEQTVGRSDVYANQIYDAKSLIAGVQPTSQLAKISSNFYVELDKINYQPSINGQLRLRVNLIEKATNNLISPQWDRDREPFFDNEIDIKGFKPITTDLQSRLDAEYEKLRAKPPTFNETGVKLILENPEKAEELINFDDSNSSNYIEKLLDPILGTQKQNNGQFQVGQFLTEPTKRKPVLVDKTAKQIKFNFSILLAEKTNPQAVLATNKAFNQELTLSYQVNFQHQLRAKDFFENKTVDEALKEIGNNPQTWLWNNKVKLFDTNSQALLLNQSWITNVKTRALDNSLIIEAEFGPTSQKQFLSAVMIGFKSSI